MPAIWACSPCMIVRLVEVLIRTLAADASCPEKTALALCQKTMQGKYREGATAGRAAAVGSRCGCRWGSCRSEPCMKNYVHWIDGLYVHWIDGLQSCDSISFASISAYVFGFSCLFSSFSRRTIPDSNIYMDSVIYHTCGTQAG